MIILLLSRRAARGRVTTSSLKAIVADHPPAVLFLVTFTAMFLMAAMRDAGIDSRMLSPAYVPVTLILLKFGSHLIDPIQRRITVFVRRVPSALLALWLCFPLANVTRSTAGRFKNGAGYYNTMAWRESKTVAYAKQMLSNNDNVHVYSNGPDVL